MRYFLARARARKRAGSATRRRSFAAVSRCNFNCLEGFSAAIAPKSPLLREGDYKDCGDDEGMPLICPTCQLFFFEAFMPPAGCLLLCMGVVFDIFRGAPHVDGSLAIAL